MKLKHLLLGADRSTKLTVAEAIAESGYWKPASVITRCREALEKFAGAYKTSVAKEDLEWLIEEVEKHSLNGRGK